MNTMNKIVWIVVGQDQHSGVRTLIGYESRRKAFREGKKPGCYVNQCEIIPKKFTRPEKRVPKKIGANVKKKKRK